MRAWTAVAPLVAALARHDITTPYDQLAEELMYEPE